MQAPYVLIQSIDKGIECCSTSIGEQLPWRNQLATASSITSRCTWAIALHLVKNVLVKGESDVKEYKDKPFLDPSFSNDLSYPGNNSRADDDAAT